VGVQVVGQQGDGAPPVSASPAAGRPRRLAELVTAPDVPEAAALVRVIALDGPAGTGKSSVARGVAARLGWRFVDTGATYRAVTLAVLEAGVDPEVPAAVEAVARELRLVLVTDPLAPGVLLDGRDVAAQVRSDQVTAHVSAVSSVPAVRALLIALQRHAMGTGGAVVEGRDIATVVAPRAGLKVYLDARPEVRAARRAAELPSGASPTHVQAEHRLTNPAAPPLDAAQLREQAVGADLARRDQRDSQTNRLVASHGAIEVDTSDRTLDQVINEVLRLAEASGVRA
jgi:cytidylate kinase